MKGVSFSVEHNPVYCISSSEKNSTSTSVLSNESQVCNFKLEDDLIFSFVDNAFYELIMSENELLVLRPSAEDTSFGFIESHSLEFNKLVEKRYNLNSLTLISEETRKNFEKMIVFSKQNELAKSKEIQHKFFKNETKIVNEIGTFVKVQNGGILICFEDLTVLEFIEGKIGITKDGKHHRELSLNDDSGFSKYIIHLKNFIDYLSED